MAYTYAFNVFTGKLDITGDTTATDARYLLLAQPATPQVTSGNFAFPGLRLFVDAGVTLTHSVIGGYIGNYYTAGKIGNIIFGGAWQSDGGIPEADDGSGKNYSLGNWGTVLGGLGNKVVGNGGTVVGGRWNEAEEDCFIGGGRNNLTEACTYSYIPGGTANWISANYAFASGNKCRITHQGAFLWSGFADDTFFNSAAAEEVAFRAWGGVRFQVASAITTSISTAGLLTTADISTGTLGAESATITAPAETFVTPLSVPEVVSVNELVTNGGLASDDNGWTVGAGWSWSATGEVHATGSGYNSFSQNITVVAGAWYRISITTSGITQGALTVTLGGRKAFYGLTGNTTNTTTVRATNTTGLFITATTTAFNGTVDNISVKRISPGFGNFGTGFSAGTSSPTSFIHIAGATNGDEGTLNGAGSLVYINQTAGWSAAQPWALYVKGYTNLGDFRINSGDGIRALYGIVSGRQMGFAANDGIITFTNGANGNTTRMTIQKNGTITLGAGVAGLDQILQFDGETNDGYLTWMEDEDYFKFADDVMMADAENIVLDTTTGTKIGTATNQKLGFFNSAPIVQPTGDVITALENLGLVATPTISVDRIACIKFYAETTAWSTGDGVAYWTVPIELNGYNIVNADVAITTVSSSGTPTVQINNLDYSGGAQDVLSTLITIDANEYNSYTAAAQPVINTTYDDVATGNRLRIDIDVTGTGTKGGTLYLTFRKP